MENGWVGEVKSCGWGDGMRGGAACMFVAARRCRTFHLTSLPQTYTPPLPSSHPWFSQAEHRNNFLRSGGKKMKRNKKELKLEILKGNR